MARWGEGTKFVLLQEGEYAGSEPMTEQRVKEWIAESIEEGDAYEDDFQLFRLVPMELTIKEKEVEVTISEDC